MATGSVPILESTTRLIMDDESSYKPDDIKSLNARSHKDHLNESDDETFMGTHGKMVETPYGDGSHTNTKIKREKA